ncbi:hypothetical protein [Guggenheimella bovis]
MIKEYRKLKEFVPELDERFQVRYLILTFVSEHPLCGRRTLSSELEIKEREVRNEIQFLAQKGYLEVTPKGLLILPVGNNVIERFRTLFKKVKNKQK